MNVRDLRLGILCALLVTACLLYLPFMFTGLAGEMDTMRMVIGILKSIAADTDYVGYNHSISFGYYQILHAFAPLFENNRESVVIALNLLNAVIAILFVIPFFYLVRRYWGIATAIVSNIVLMAVPVWWSSSLYGHPMMLAAFCNIVGLALLGSKNNLSDLPRKQTPPGPVRLLAAITAFAIALTFRLDAILMFPLITAILWLEGYNFKGAVWRSLVYGFVALTIAFIVKILVVGSGETGLSMTLDRMLHWHNLTRFVQNMERGTAAFVLAFHPLLVTMFLGACVYLVRQKDWRTLFFILVTSALNYLFWLPNPLHSRHFLFIAPTLAVGVSILLVALVSRFLGSKQHRLASFSSAAAALVLVLSAVMSELIFPIVQALYPWDHGVQNHSIMVPIRSTLLNKYYLEARLRSDEELGNKMYKLEPIDMPILVITDHQLPVLVAMATLSDATALSIDKEKDVIGTPMWRVKTTNNMFFLPDTYKADVVELLNKTNTYDNYIIIIDRASSFGQLNSEDFVKNVRLVELSDRK